MRKCRPATRHRNPAAHEQEVTMSGNLQVKQSTVQLTFDRCKTCLGMFCLQACGFSTAKQEAAAQGMPCNFLDMSQLLLEFKSVGAMRALKCSATSHDSKAEYSREVATPQNRRPTSRTPKMSQCLVAQPITYVTTYVSAAFFLPLHTSHCTLDHSIQRTLCPLLWS